MIRTYGARPASFVPAPKPANFDELSRAAAAREAAQRQHDDSAAADAQDAFLIEHGKYRDQALRAGVAPGTLLGVLDENGNVS